MCIFPLQPAYTLRKIIEEICQSFADVSVRWGFIPCLFVPTKVRDEDRGKEKGGEGDDVSKQRRGLTAMRHTFTYLTTAPTEKPNTFNGDFKRDTPPIKTNRFPQHVMSCVTYNNPPPPDV